jgi:hypothetical protein
MAFLLKRRYGRDIAKKNGTVPFKTGRNVILIILKCDSTSHRENKNVI